MPHAIRFTFTDSQGRTLFWRDHDGMFAGVAPLRVGGHPARALMSQTVLEGSHQECELRALFLRKACESDPARILFRKEASEAPIGSVHPFPECADWIHFEGRGWFGSASGSDGKPFEAPLFAFWLAQALFALGNPKLPPPPPPERLEPWDPVPEEASPSLGWHWRRPSEPREAMILLGYACASYPSQPAPMDDLASLCGAELAAAIAGSQPAAFRALAGSDQALLARLDSVDIGHHAGPAHPSMLSKRL